MVRDNERKWDKRFKLSKSDIAEHNRLYDEEGERHAQYVRNIEERKRREREENEERERIKCEEQRKWDYDYHRFEDRQQFNDFIGRW
ncbi:unnamed protein product [Phytomonas sp. Hart1]|nr:unnamed protein product [Phytomonas sp. Hart1]|eukprot:CCW72158.1 unnamed protein product [Phytomonas sp. isolate Hart1]